MPDCESVNDVNTPTAYSGISALVMPPKATMQRAGRDREEQDAVREHEPVAAVRELTRQVAVPGDDRRAAAGSRRRPCSPPASRMAAVANCSTHVERARRRTRPGPSARTPSRRGSGTGGGGAASTETPKNSVPRMTAIQVERVAAFLRLRPPERGDAVADRLDTGERDRTRREALQDEEEAERAAGLARAPSNASLSNGHLPDVAEVAPDEPKTIITVEDRRCRRRSAPRRAAPTP